MILYVIGTISLLNPSFKTAKDAALLIPKGTAVSIYLNSPGGRIDEGFEFGRVLAHLNATCYVKYAASAALEVIMPACQKIVLMPESRLVFHSATWCIQGMRDTADMLADLRTGLSISATMATLSEKLWGDAVCSKEINAKYPELAKFSCAVRHMMNETELTGSQFTAIFPGVATRVKIITKEVFPNIPDPEASGTMKSSTECEQY